ncbi:MAG TPA: T9SS type A sorting domain-containing protein [Bacteroidia bacterium]|nr:T9SS type A sorting domain-containing protein [Bacteroidia bacterium]
MKALILVMAIAPLICCGQNFNNNTGMTNTGDAAPFNTGTDAPSFLPGNNMAGIPCNSNTFWANTHDSILEFQFNGTTINTPGNTVVASYNYSTAYAANLNGSFSPTFYDCVSQNAYYYDGSSWTIAGSGASFNIYNGGGSGNYLYFDGATGGNINTILRFDGTNFNPIYTTLNNRMITMYDIAVDQNGNSYFLTGYANQMSDSLVVIDTIGNIVVQIPFTLNTSNAYGSFIMNSVFYIGFGFSNPVYPTSLLPITFSGSSATAGTPIPFPGSGGYIDLESCNQGLPLYISTANALVNRVSITNPAKNISTVKSAKEKIIRIHIYETSGKEIKIIEVNNLSVQINVSGFSDGFYILNIEFKDAVVKQKLIVQNN